jgi:hypothetical protein
MPVFPLKKMPEEVKKYILKVQAEIKIKKGTSNFSQESTIYKIIREHKDFFDKK